MIKLTFIVCALRHLTVWTSRLCCLLAREQTSLHLGTIPRNFIVQEFVPQLELLQRTALFITHGGMNSVSEALYYGVPLVVIPQSADQNLVGQRIEQLGAGKALRRTSVTAQRLRSVAEDILAKPAYQQG